jgi:hypothetical protein
MRIVFLPVVYLVDARIAPSPAVVKKGYSEAV